MNEKNEQTTIVRLMLDRLRGGDDSARPQLLEYVWDRVRRIARKQLRDFPRIRRWEETGDVLNAAMLHLNAALKETVPPTPRDFFSFCSVHIRRQLLDLTRHYHGKRGMGRQHRTRPPAGQEDTHSPAELEPSSDTDDPAKLALWTEFHEQVQKLPDEEREVFELLWYHDLTQEAAAETLGVSTKSVSRRWREARVRLGKFLKDGMK